MDFALIIIFMFVAFALTTLFRKWVDIPTLLGVAIGCAVNANIFNPIKYGVTVGPFVFSIEVVLYTLFMYTIVIRILDYGYQDAKKMTFTTVAAIVISAIIELFAELAAKAPAKEVLKDFSYYLFSSVGTIVGVWVMIFITIKLRKFKVSDYVILPLVIAISTVIHAGFYYGGIALVEMKGDVYTVKMLLGALVGKSICIELADICYFINKKLWIPLNLVSAQKENKIEK